MERTETNKKYDEQRCGAFAEDLWSLYMLVPRLSKVEYRFHQDDGNETEILHISKFEVSPEYAKKQLDIYLNKFGPGPYSLKVDWVYGFGNNINIDVFK